MKNKLLRVTAGFAAVIVLLTCLLYFNAPVQNQNNDGAMQLVALNEISLLLKSGDTEQAQEKISALEENIRNTEVVQPGNNQIFLIGGVSLLFLMAVSLYFHFAILKPFDKLKDFAETICPCRSVISAAICGFTAVTASVIAVHPFIGRL